MIGHEPLIGIRRRGKVPRLVWLSLDDDPCQQARDWPAWGPHAVVSIQPHDSIALLDLRFLVSLNCIVNGDDSRRVYALHEACLAAGAKRVISHVLRPERFGEFGIVDQRDSAQEVQECPNS
jgi:hypothetical protein